MTLEDIDIIKTIVNSDLIETIWIGNEVVTDIIYDIMIANDFEV